MIVYRPLWNKTWNMHQSYTIFFRPFGFLALKELYIILIFKAFDFERT